MDMKYDKIFCYELYKLYFIVACDIEIESCL